MKQIEKYPSFVLTLALICIITAGCQDYFRPVSFTKVELEHTKLIDGIESYQSIKEFEVLLYRGSYKWVTNEGSRSSTKSKAPFLISNVTIKNYSHLGFSGDLVISFFNNRLISTTFYPVKTEQYIDALMKETAVTFDHNQEAKLPPHTLVQSAVDHKGQKYIKWSDIRLDKEVDLWIKRYS